jgi:predicted NAD/FAD-dependent oxidoreductase
VLRTAGIDVVVLEREAEPGGRFGSVRLDGRPVDHGAAYFTVSDPAFEAVARSWRAAELARPWTDTFKVFDPDGVTQTRGPMRWSAPSGLRSLTAHLAADLAVEYETPVAGLPDADVVVLAMPRPEAARLTPLPPRSWSAVHTVVLRYPERTWPAFGGAFVNDHPVLSTVCDDGSRRGDDAPVLVAHAAPKTGGADVAAAVGALLGITAQPDVDSFHWPFARPDDAIGHAFEFDGHLGLAGDEFGPARAQTAWLSGRALGLSIALSLA